MLQKKKILAITEESSSQDIIASSLTKEGFEIKIFSSSEEALKNLYKENPDLVIIDYLSPHVNGLEFCMKIRKNFLFRYLPLIILVPKDNPSIKEECIQKGVDEFIEKPFNSQDLLFRVKIVLQRIFHYQDIHPLTKLPGFSSLIKEINSLIDKKEIFGVAYADLSNFRKFNEYYGFKRGDNVLLFVSNIIKEVLQELGSEIDFLSHIGNDDFIFISSAESIEDVCEQIINIFSENILIFYDEKDKNQGFILIKDRRGKLVKYPFLRIHIGVVTNQFYPFISPAQVLQITTELKDYAKKFEKSIYVKERRKSYPFY